MKQDVLKNYSNGTLRKLRDNLCRYKLDIVPAEISAFLCKPLKTGGLSINNKVRRVIALIDKEIVDRFVNNEKDTYICTDKDSRCVHNSYGDCRLEPDCEHRKLK
jgi:hypothetical protein